VRDSATVVTIDRNIPGYATLIPAGTDYYAYSDEVDLAAVTDIETLHTQHVTLHDAVGNGGPLLHISEHSQVDFGFPRGSGRPVSWTDKMVDTAVGQRGLWVGPLAPDAIYQIHFYYSKTPTALSADGDTSDFPPSMRHIFVTGALRDIYRQDEFRDTDLALKAERKFERDLQLAWRHEKRTRPRAHYVRPFDNRRVVGGITFVIEP
jgi:hypothetical protein